MLQQDGCGYVFPVQGPGSLQQLQVRVPAGEVIKAYQLNCALSFRE